FGFVRPHVRCVPVAPIANAAEGEGHGIPIAIAYTEYDDVALGPRRQPRVRQLPLPTATEDVGPVWITGYTERRDDAGPRQRPQASERLALGGVCVPTIATDDGRDDANDNYPR